MPIRIVVLSAVLITLPGCAGAPTRSASGLGDSSSISSVRDESAADIVHVTCERDAIRLDAAVVRAHRDGVRFAFENPGGMWGYMFHPETWDHGQASGSDFRGPGSITNETFALPPGEVIVACLRANDSTYDDPEAATATLTIVDPDGLYVPPEPACGFGEQSRITITAGRDKDWAEVFRRVPGIRPSDEFRKPNYPESPQYGPTAMVLRDGTAVGRIMSFGTDWELLINACPGSGIAEE